MKLSKVALIVLLIILIYILSVFLMSKCSCKKQVTFKDPVVDKIKIIPPNEPKQDNVYPDIITKQTILFSSKDNKSMYTNLTNYL